MMDGEIVQINNLTSSNIGDLNPFRYRSYYYGQETGYYYLNSRYYDSNVGRFINSDEISNLGVNNDVQSLNVYAYCANNPIHRYDEAGDVWDVILFGAIVGFGSQIITNALEGEPWYKDVVGATVGGAVSTFAGGLGGIMFGNAVSVSLNYMEARICGREYSDTEAATELVSNMFLDVGVGMVTGTIIDVDTNAVSFLSPDNARFGNKFKKSLKCKNAINYVETVIDYSATIVDFAAKEVVNITLQKAQEKIQGLFNKRLFG